MPEYTQALSIDEVPSGTGKLVSLKGKEIALFNVDGCFYAIDNQCPHRQGPLSEGTLEGTVVSCPWHGWRFDVASGNCKMNPLAKVGAYPTKVENQRVFIEI